MRRLVKLSVLSGSLWAAITLLIAPPSAHSLPAAAPPDPPRTPHGKQQALPQGQPPEISEECGKEEPSPSNVPSPRRRSYTPETPTFALKFQDEISPYYLMSAFVQPGEKLDLEAVLTNRGDRFEACAESGTLQRIAAQRWRWVAPRTPGLYPIFITNRTSAVTMRLNVFVLTPYGGEDRLEGYRIGRYERVPLYDNPVYAMPSGMVRVEESDLDIWLTPHFQLRQFVCKQKGSFPKYLIVSSRLLLKLEMLLSRVNARGVEADTFAVLSAYRTPYYNASIGNRTKYSRHAYGDAADIYIDQDGDGRMDDLNGDGRSNVGDADLLRGIVEEIDDEAWYLPFIGGLGLYGPKPHRGPFIHVDTRGFKARW